MRKWKENSEKKKENYKNIMREWTEKVGQQNRVRNFT